MEVGKVSQDHIKSHRVPRTIAVACGMQYGMQWRPWATRASARQALPDLVALSLRACQLTDRGAAPLLAALWSGLRRFQKPFGLKWCGPSRPHRP